MTITETRFLKFWRTINAANFIMKLPALTAGEAHRAWCAIRLEDVQRRDMAANKRGNV